MCHAEKRKRSLKMNLFSENKFAESGDEDTETVPRWKQSKDAKIKD